MGTHEKRRPCWRFCRSEQLLPFLDRRTGSRSKPGFACDEAGQGCVRMKPGKDADGIAKSEADHFMHCPGCGQRFDMRDLGQVMSAHPRPGD